MEKKASKMTKQNHIDSYYQALNTLEDQVARSVNARADDEDMGED